MVSARLANAWTRDRPRPTPSVRLRPSGESTGVTHSQDAVTMTPDLDACGPGVFSYDTSTTITSQ